MTTYELSSSLLEEFSEK